MKQQLPMKIDFQLIAAFLAVAEELSFRSAAERLGISRPAVSQSIRKLEAATGAALFQRTTRSVRLTSAGSELYQAVAPSVLTIASALESVGPAEAPRGHLKIAATSIAEEFLAGPLLTRFVEAHPHISVEVTVTDAQFDIVGEGFDAGVRLHELIERDMIAVPLTDEEQEVAVAAPRYLERCGQPHRPRDLLDHCCIGWRPAHDRAPYRWEFVEDGKPFSLAVEPRFTTNDLRLMMRMALAGAGITFATRSVFAPYLASGRLKTLLENYQQPFRGLSLFFPAAREKEARLRALVDHIRTWRQIGHGTEKEVGLA